MPNPPLGVPTDIEFSMVPVRSFTEATGGRLFKFNGEVVVRIDGDSSGVFSVSSLETDRLVRDPELPPGSPPVWTTIDTVQGTGPINTRAAEALLIIVGFACPDTEQTAFSARL